MTCAVNIPNQMHQVYVVGSDKKIWHSIDTKNAVDAGVTISQLAITENCNALFAGVGEPDRPGSVQIYKINHTKYKDEKIKLHIDK